MAPLRRHLWALGFAAVGAGVVALHLGGLATAPPGLHFDEASIGYNAWAIAHHGVDEWGRSFPLFFRAEGEYKNPLYIYLLAPFTWVLPLTPATERLPAALCGLATCLLITLFAHRLSGSRPAAMATLLTVALTPWAVIDARVGLEVSTLVVCLAAALWCVAHLDVEPLPPRWALAAGIALGAAVYAYTIGRLLVALLVAALLLADRRLRSWRRAAPLLVPVLVAYLALGAYAISNPDAIFHRFAGLSIWSDQPGPVAVVARFVRNYLSYVDPRFLFTHGDANLRQNTGYGGMLLVMSLPAIATGIAICWRRRHQPLPTFLLLGLVAGPIPAALTNDGTPHSLRSIGMLPFLLGIAVFGWAAILPLLTARRLLFGVAAAAAAIEAGGYMFDLYTRYPDRALTTFDTGHVEAIRRAHDLAGGHRMLLSSNLDFPWISALFALRPDPPSRAVSGSINQDDERRRLASLSILQGTPEQLDAAATSGDVLVLAPSDHHPAGAALVDMVSVTVDTAEPFAVEATTRPATVVLVDIWRR
ncbi:MAG TPA: glycosyltransferase family 39 protein [Candidatus Dormibacteraeota bacterium]|nr:glycosyltransferase family 39 protein [Candidatus Dormibacteraeota bacterium]